MWDDDDSVFPTRQGNAPGKSMERKMQGSGQGDFRTVIRDNPDGSTTMLRTRNGFPEFTTTTASVEQSYTGIVEIPGTRTTRGSTTIYSPCGLDSMLIVPINRLRATIGKVMTYRDYTFKDGDAAADTSVIDSRPVSSETSRSFHGEDANDICYYENTVIVVKRLSKLTFSNCEYIFSERGAPIAPTTKNGNPFGNLTEFGFTRDDPFPIYGYDSSAHADIYTNNNLNKNVKIQFADRFFEPMMLVYLYGVQSRKKMDTATQDSVITSLSDVSIFGWPYSGRFILSTNELVTPSGAAISIPPQLTGFVGGGSTASHRVAGGSPGDRPTRAPATIDIEKGFTWPDSRVAVGPNRNTSSFTLGRVSFFYVDPAGAVWRISIVGCDVVFANSPSFTDYISGGVYLSATRATPINAIGAYPDSSQLYIPFTEAHMPNNVSGAITTTPFNMTVMAFKSNGSQALLVPSNMETFVPDNDTAYYTLDMSGVGDLDSERPLFGIGAAISKVQDQASYTLTTGGEHAHVAYSTSHFYGLYDYTYVGYLYGRYDQNDNLTFAKVTYRDRHTATIDKVQVQQNGVGDLISVTEVYTLDYSVKLEWGGTEVEVHTTGGTETHGPTILSGVLVDNFTQAYSETTQEGGAVFASFFASQNQNASAGKIAYQHTPRVVSESYVEVDIVTTADSGVTESGAAVVTFTGAALSPGDYGKKIAVNPVTGAAYVPPTPSDESVWI